MNNESPNQSATEPLIVGIDWADSKHDLTVIDSDTTKHLRISADNDDVAELTRT